MIRMILILAGCLLLAPQEDAVDELVERLQDPSITERDEAEASLVKMGERSVARLERHAGSSEDLEVRARIARIIRTIRDLPWTPDVDAALKRAAKSGRKVLVLSAPAAINEPT